MPKTSRGGRRGSGGGNATVPNTPAKANTPSGVSYAQFMQMPDSQKYDTINNIINDRNIQVPSYLDNSETSKVLYGLGMNNKPAVVSDAQLDTMQGRELFRTVYERGTMPPPASGDVIDQIRTGDYTQMSGAGGSAHGRAIYFATSFNDSKSYGTHENNPRIMRAKINPTANVRSQTSLVNQMSNDATWNASKVGSRGNHPYANKDNIALYALSHGVDAWYSGSYTMVVNRGALTASDQTRHITKRATNGLVRLGTANSWSEGAIAK